MASTASHTQLTRHAVREAATAEKQHPSFQPIVQILNIQNVAYKVTFASQPNRFRIILSDGKCYIEGMLATQLNHLVENQKLQAYNTVRIRSFVVDEIKGKKLMTVLVLDVLDESIKQKIGNPIDIHDYWPRPHWAKLPLEETEYSDWQIDVQFPGNISSKIGSEEYDYDSMERYHNVEGVMASYLVHRYMLGPQSEYFNSIFRDDSRFSESYERRSVISFPADAPVNLEFFEDLLDFFYETDRKTMSLNPDKALAMLYFADYFGIAKLRQMSLDFLRNRIGRPPSMEWLAKVFVLAERLYLETFQQEMARQCHTRILMMWPFLPPESGNELWRCLCREQQRKPIKSTIEWSCQITYFCLRYPDSVDPSLFSLLTDSGVMPQIDTVQSAITLLEQERRLGLDERESNTLTCLQQRAADRLYDKERRTWRLSENPPPKEVLEKLRCLKPAVMESLLLRAMESHRIDNTP